MTADDQGPSGDEGEQVMLVVRLDTKPGAEAQMTEALSRLAEARLQPARSA